MKETTKLRRFISNSITKNKISDNELEISHCWFNTNKTVTDNGICELKEYIDKNKYIKSIIIVNNVEITRPQRTWGDLPEWIRPDSMFNRFDKYNYDNSFILIIFDNYEQKELEYLIKSIPDKSTYEIINKEEKNEI